MNVGIPLVLLTAAVLVAWLVVAPMPEGKTKRALARVADRLSRAVLFGGSIGAVLGIASCPDHFSVSNTCRYTAAWALIGVGLWGLGSLIMGRPRSS